MTNKLPLKFYRQNDVLRLSKELLGKYLFTRIGPEAALTGGMIIETEGYKGVEDKACHAYNGRRTKRTETMYCQGGVTYVYLCYGMHHLLNIVTHAKDVPHAILIRAIRPEVGLETMLKRRNKTSVTKTLANGPGTLCQALGINRSHDKIALNSDTIWIEDRGIQVKQTDIVATARIGVAYAKEDALNPWRFIYNV